MSAKITLLSTLVVLLSIVASLQRDDVQFYIKDFIRRQGYPTFMMKDSTSEDVSSLQSILQFDGLDGEMKIIDTALHPPSLELVAADFNTDLSEIGWLAQELGGTDEERRLISDVLIATKVHVSSLSSDELRLNCKNSNSKCAFWSSIGECTNNPGYMIMECAPACQTCNKLDYKFDKQEHIQ